MFNFYFSTKGETKDLTSETISVDVSLQCSSGGIMCLISSLPVGGRVSIQEFHLGNYVQSIGSQLVGMEYYFLWI